MSTEVEVDTSTLEDLEFDTTCGMTWFTFARKDRPIPCNKTANFTCRYYSCTQEKWLSIPICSGCLGKLFRHPDHCFTGRCEDIPNLVTEILPLRGN